MSQKRETISSPERTREMISSICFSDIREAFNSYSIHFGSAAA
jgi:hypothetical protein